MQHKQAFQLQTSFQPAGDQPAAIKALCDSILQGNQHQLLLGVTGSGKTFTMANVIAKLQRPTIIMAHNKTLAAQLYSEFRAFFPNNAVEYFVSASDTYIEKDSAINEHIDQMRLSATKALLERRDAIIIASVSAIYGLGDPEAYLKMLLHISRGERIDQRAMLRRLAEMQYQRNDLDFSRGTYRVRGEVIDIFPAESDDRAVRVSLFDDEVENISYFDPLTGALIQKVGRVTIYPKSHYVTPKEQIYKAIDTIRAELEPRLAWLLSENKLIEAQRLKERCQYDLEMLQQLGYCNGIENYSRHLSGRNEGEAPPTLFDYVPADALLIIDESHVSVPQIGAMYKGDRARKENLVNYGFRLPSALDNRPMKFEEWEKISPQTIFVSATPANYEKELCPIAIEQVVRPTGLVDPIIEIRPAFTQVDDLMSEITLRVAVNERVLVTTLTKRMAEDLSSYLAEHKVKVRYLHSDIDTIERIEIIRDLRLGVFDVLIGINLLREGLDMPEVSLVAILDADKEGFLRSERSLIQTIGRAARHLNGKAILYAERMTGSMERAIAETDRRRAKQIAFNTANGITPKSVSKPILDIMEMYGVPSKEPKHNSHAQAAQPVVAEYVVTDTKVLVKRIKELEVEMMAKARDLQFEQAAKLRDEMMKLKEQLLIQKL